MPCQPLACRRMKPIQWSIRWQKQHRPRTHPWQQLGEGILTIGATAKSVKGGTAELNTALGILANNGIKGAEGGTHLRNVILALQSPTDKAAACMESLGLQVYDSQGKS